MHSATFANHLAANDVATNAPSLKMRWATLGALSGFVFGTALAAITLATNIVIFGLFDTLAVALVECAVIAGGFAAMAAAIFDHDDSQHHLHQEEK